MCNNPQVVYQLCEFFPKSLHTLDVNFLDFEVRQKDSFPTEGTAQSHVPCPAAEFAMVTELKTVMRGNSAAENS